LGSAVSSGTGGQDSQVVMIDSSTSNNQPSGNTDPNSANNVTISISSIDDGDANTTATDGSKDTGSSANDFITSDGTLSLQGVTANFDSTQGDKVHLQVLDANNLVVIDQYVTPNSATGQWSYNNQSTLLLDGNYTIKAAIVDVAGNEIKVATDVPLVIDSSSTNQKNGSIDPNISNAAGITIGSIDDGDSTKSLATGSKDTGSSASDFITSDGTLIYQGTTYNFSATDGHVVHLLVFTVDGILAVNQYIQPNSITGEWRYDSQGQSLPDGAYIIQAAIEDAAGNVVQAATDQIFVVDSDGSNNVDPNNPNSQISPDANSLATVIIDAISLDSGVSSIDFIKIGRAHV
jgi:hypothetical protein